MTELLTEFIKKTFTVDPRITTVLLSLIPLVETRGAITVGMELGVAPWLTWLLACSSVALVAPVLFYGVKPILTKMKKGKRTGRFAESIEELFKGKAEKIEGNKTKWKKTLGVFLFVAIPLPLTGVWTGAAASAFIDLDGKYALPALIIGNYTAGLLVLLLNLALGKYASLLLLVLFAFILISILSISYTLTKKRRKQ